MKTKNENQTFPSHLTEAEQRKCEDFEWALHDQDVQRKYGGTIVVVYHKKVLGAGKTYQTAWDAARRRVSCPANTWIAMPVVPHNETAQAKRRRQPA